LLKFRLEYLYNVVDYFVLVESTTTFAGNKKNYILMKINPYLINMLVKSYISLIIKKLMFQILG